MLLKSYRPLLIVLGLSLLALTCAKLATDSEVEGITADCQGCHTDEAMLRATAIVDDDGGDDDAGEG